MKPITNLADVSAELGTLYHLLEAATKDIAEGMDASDPEVRPRELERGQSLLAVFEERFERLYNGVVYASCEGADELARLNSDIPY